jgi:hypothetical protein
MDNQVYPASLAGLIIKSQNYKALARKKAQIYQTEREGELVFTVQVDKSGGDEETVVDTICTAPARGITIKGLARRKGYNASC